MFYALLLVLVIILFVRQHNLKKDYKGKLEGLEQDIKDLWSLVESLKKRIMGPPYTETVVETEGPETKAGEPQPPIIPKPPPTYPPPDMPGPPPLPSTTPGIESVPPSKIAISEQTFQIDSEPDARIEKETVAPEIEPPGDRADSGWVKHWEEFKSNVDWELFTGTKLFAWLGGIALFIGAGFFVKYSIDRDLIPPALRLAIGALTGIVLIIASGRFERVRYEILRHTLGACGIGVLYSVVFAATLYYHYLTKPLGFGLLTVVSAAAFVLAVFQRGIAISVLGALGAYATPILVSTGRGSLIMLFLYLSIINIGLYYVVIKLKSAGLLLMATAGTICTLALGAYAGHEIPRLTIALVWMANLALFSVFLGLMKETPEENQPLSWTGNLLYLSAPVVSLWLLNWPGSAPFLLVTAAMAGAVILAFRNRGWSNRVIPYGAITFGVAFLWAGIRFNPQTVSWSFALMLIYGAVGGLGPIILIRKYGLDKISMHWFNIFPVALGVVILIAILKSPQVSFWFWPIVLALELLGILISLAFGALIQVGLLALFLIISGLAWILRIPADSIGLGFYGFLLFAGAFLCIAILYAILKLPGWIRNTELETSLKDPFEAREGIMEWIVASPAMGAFTLLSVAFWVQSPLRPHPGMVTLVCFLGLALFLSKRLFSQPLSIVVLMSAAFAQGVWIFRPALEQDLFILALTWSGALFISALIAPFVFFRYLEKWPRVWMAWALFETIQGLFVIWAADNL